jgi:hypothetical protein
MSRIYTPLPFASCIVVARQFYFHNIKYNTLTTNDWCCLWWILYKSCGPSELTCHGFDMLQWSTSFFYSNTQHGTPEFVRGGPEL